MAKKYNRDMPLPSSDGMFGGPGDPKKKYTGLQEKVNIAKNLYKDNPSKVFSDAVKRAERNLADSISASKPMYKKK